MPKISTELSPEEHAALTAGSVLRPSQQAPGPGRESGNPRNDQATVTDTTAAGVVLDLLRRGQG